MINCRYTDDNRRAILDSRVTTTRLLHQAMGELQHPPRVWLNAATATIYRHSLDRVFDVFLNLVRHGLGGTIGSGAQFVSWIHDADFARAVDLLSQRDDLEGVVNLASPNPIPNRDLLA